MQAEYVSGLHRSREKNPNLTVFDTGEMLEPICVVDEATGRKTGAVIFEDDESHPVLVIDAGPSTMHDDTVVVQIDTDGLVGDKIMVVINDGPALCHFDPETEEPPMVEAVRFLQNEIADRPFSIQEYDAILASICKHFGVEYPSEGGDRA